MTDFEEHELWADFLSWSGGFPPESECEITVYLDYAKPSHLAREDVYEFLCDWYAAESI